MKNTTTTLTTILVSFALILAALTGCGETQDTTAKAAKESDLERYNLSGQVKTLTKKVYRAYDKLGTPTKNELTIHNIFNYNDKGMDSEIIIIDTTDKIVQRITTQYDSLNRVTEKTRVDNQDTRKQINLYDSLNHLSEIRYYNGTDELKYRHIFEVNENGTPVKANYSRTETDPGVIRYAYKYDDKNNEIEKITYEDNGAVMHRMEYQYDDQGRRIGEIRYNSDGEQTNKETYKFDENGNRIAFAKFTVKGLNFRSESKFNEHNHVIMVEYFDHRNNNTGTYQYEYKYDDNNNWIENIQYQNYVPNEIIEREIIYY